MTWRGLQRTRPALLSGGIAAILIALSIHATAGGPATYGTVDAIVTEVYDGDTLRVEIPSWPSVVGSRIGVRVYGVDCRELSSGATAARDQVRRWIQPGETVRLTDIRRDKYFRLLAKVGYDCHATACRDLGSELIKHKLAAPYYGGTKQAFTEEIK